MMAQLTIVGAAEHMIDYELGIFTKSNQYDPNAAMTAKGVKYREMLVELEIKMKIGILLAYSCLDVQNLDATQHPYN